METIRSRAAQARTTSGQRLLAALIAWTTVAGLAACGGGGSAPVATGQGAPGSAALVCTVTPGTGLPVAESDYLLAELASSDPQHQTVVVWDPAQPETVVETVDLASGGGTPWTSSHLQYTEAASYDPGTLLATTLGRSKVFFDCGGQLLAIDLRGGRSHAPTALSGATDIQGVAQVVTLDAAGQSAWVIAQGASHDWAISTAMGAADSPHQAQALAALRDAATGLPTDLFVDYGIAQAGLPGSDSFGVVDLDFHALPDTTLATMGADQTTIDHWLAADPAQPGLAYVLINQQVRLLRWNAQGISVDAAPAYTFATPGWSTATADAGAVYFTDTDTLYSLANGQVAPIGTFTQQADTLVDAGGAIIAIESIGEDARCCNQWEALAKTGGAPVVLAAGFYGTGTAVLAGAGPLGALFQDPQASLTAPGGGAVGSYGLVSTAGTTLWTSPGLGHGIVLAQQHRLDQPPAPIAVLACQPDLAGGASLTGTVNSIDLGTGVATALGTLPTGATMTEGSFVAGLPGNLAIETLTVVGQTSEPSFETLAPDTRDAWQLIPGSPGSLQQTTHYLP